MALTDLQRLRLRVADNPHPILNETMGIGDGVVTAFQTQLAPLISGSLIVKLVSVAGAVTTLAPAEYTVDLALGTITIHTPPTSGTRVVVVYQWTVFSDAELNDILALQPTLQAATIATIEILLVDTERFIKYTVGQETIDRSVAYQALTSLLQSLRKTAAGVTRVLLATEPEQRESLMPWLRH